MPRRTAQAVTLAIAVTAATMMSPARLSARSTDRQCKAIRDAVGQGMTMAQLVQQFDTDEAHIQKCVQAKGRKRKTKADPKSKTHTQSTSGKATHATHSATP